MTLRDLVNTSTPGTVFRILCPPTYRQTVRAEKNALTHTELRREVQSIRIPDKDIMEVRLMPYET